MEYLEQFTKDLVFTTSTNAAILENLTILKTLKKNVFENFELEITIIGESHYLHLTKNGKTIFIELLSCLYRTGNLHTFVFNDMSAHSCHIDEEEFTYSIDIARRDDLIECLNIFREPTFELIFPGDSVIPAKTSIILNVEDNVISLKTLHLYPNENQGVITNSTLFIK